MLEEEEEEEGEDEEGMRGLELDMWEGQFSLGGVGEGLGEGVWRQEEGVSCRRLAQEVWASQQEKEEAEQETEDVFCNAVNFTSIQVIFSRFICLIFLGGYLDFQPILKLSLFDMFPNLVSPAQVQQLQEQVGQLAESQATTDDR